MLERKFRIPSKVAKEPGYTSSFKVIDDLNTVKTQEGIVKVLSASPRKSPPKQS